MKILITGANGFVGNYLVRYFLSRGNEVYGFSRPDSTNKLTNIQQYVDFKAIVDLNKCCPVDVVIHAAAQCPGENVCLSDYIKSNIFLTQDVAEYAEASHVKKVIYLSAISINGDVRENVVDEHSAIVNPDNYDITKLLGERILSERADRFATCSLRLPKVVGREAKNGWFVNLCQKAIANEPLVVYNDCASFNNLVDINDLAVFINNLCQTTLSGFDVITLASTGKVTIRELCNTILRELRSESEVIYRDSQKASFFISIDKAVATYGFKPKHIMEVLVKYCAAKMGAYKI